MATSFSERLRQTSDGTIIQGQVIYEVGSGVSGVATSDTQTLLGAAIATVTVGAEFQVCHQGYAYLRCESGLTFALGDKLYLSTFSDGYVTNIQPSGATKIIGHVSIIPDEDSTLVFAFIDIRPLEGNWGYQLGTLSGVYVTGGSDGIFAEENIVDGQVIWASGISLVGSQYLEFDGDTFGILSSGVVLGDSDSKIGVFGGAPIVKPTVTGSRGGNVALASLLTALANLGVITDSTTV